MGLDGVEIVMEVEEHFDIQLPDTALSQVTTLGELESLLLEQLQRDSMTAPDNPPACTTARLFYSMQTALSRKLSPLTSRLRPRTSLALVLPWWRRQRVLDELQQELQLRPLRLSCPGPLTLAYACVTFVFAFGITTQFVNSSLKAFILLAFIWLLLLIIGSVAAGWMRLKCVFPKECQTLGELVLYNTDTQKWCRDIAATHAWPVLCRIVSETTGVSLDKLTRQTRLEDILDR